MNCGAADARWRAQGVGKKRQATESVRGGETVSMSGLNMHWISSRPDRRRWQAAFWMMVMTLASDPRGWAAETRFLTQIRQLTLEGRRAGEGYFSADGRTLVFQSEREAENPFYQIYTLDLESGDSRRVSPGIGKTTCAFVRPGSGEVLFASTHLDPEALAKQKEELEFRASGKQRRYAWDYDEQMDLFVAAGDGSSVRRLTDAPGYDAEGAYSPDGRLIVFCSLRDAYPTNSLSAGDARRFATDPSYFGEIYLMNADGTQTRRLTRTPGYDGGPFFSPDGRRIIWRRFDEKGLTADVYTMALDGSDERRLTDFGAMSWAPYFHPSGEYAIFTANKLGFGNFELFLVDAAGTKEPVRVTTTDGFDGLPVFSPDGGRLCWTSSRTADGRSQLFMARWNDAEARSALASAPPRGMAEAATEGTNGTGAAEHGAGRVSTQAVGAFSPEIREGDMRQQVNFLASSELAGRLTGSEGARLASEYIRDHLRRAGLRPLGADWYQEFEFTAGTRLVTHENRLVVGGREFAVEQAFRPLAFSSSGTVTGSVVFAGYGLRVPGKPGEGYDSYSGLEVSNKIVMVLRYVPEEVSPERRQELNRYAGLRYKAMLARDLGAKALLVVTGPKSPGAGELVALSSDSSLSGSGIVAASVSAEVAAELLAGSGADLAARQTALDNENPHAPGGFEITNSVVRLTTKVEQVRKRDRNVVGWLPGTSSEVVVLGAHFDHLGRGEAGGAFNRKGEEGHICHGADDNASGVAVLLELAAQAAAAQAVAAADRPRRGVVFGFWSGEEIGLLGSTHFVEHAPLPLSNVVAYLNFDMVGRLREDRLLLQGVGSSTVWKRMIERRNVAAGFQVVLQEDPFLPTDSTAFYPRRVPVLAFFTGSHEDYHRPTDRQETLNYEGMVRIAGFAGRLLEDVRVAEARPDYVEVVRSSGNPGSRDSLRAYLGTIPDYGGEVEGVKLSGVRSGSPADLAGVKGGDIIVSLGGRKIGNVYDYTYSLDAVKIGQPIEMIVVREGKRIPLTVTPVARK